MFVGDYRFLIIIIALHFYVFCFSSFFLSPPPFFWFFVDNQFSSVRSYSFRSLMIETQTLKMRSLPASQCGKLYPDPISPPLLFSIRGTDHLPGQVILSCLDYLHADVRDHDGRDLSLHVQEVTGGQLVTMSLCLFFVCWYKSRKYLLRLPPCARSETPGSISNQALPVVLSQVHHHPEPLYVPTEVKTQVDGLDRISGRQPNPIVPSPPPSDPPKHSR